MDLWVRKVRLDLPAPSGLRVPGVRKDPKAHQALPVLLDHKVWLAPSEPRVPRVLPELLAHKVLLAPSVLRDKKDLPAA